MEQLKVKIAGEISLSSDPGATMRKWREVFGVTQTHLSEFLQISPSTISDYESNRRKSPGIQVIKRFVDALIKLDAEKGGELTKRFAEAESPTDYYDAINFSKSVDASDFSKAIDAKPVCCPEKLADLHLFGATIIDSVKVILDLPYDSFMKIYSTTTQRALIFTNVSTGRSPLVAIRMTPIKPTLVVLHGLKASEVDKLAIKIGENERIPVLATTKSLDEIKKELKKIG
ncbi:helix-turn-helix domain-containing protein [Candidatus Micrarchaeota archaeon]|nr:helix-turn-helix domain-containing protein [Candidatus Micrarchaeota archaeon]